MQTPPPLTHDRKKPARIRRWGLLPPALIWASLLACRGTIGSFSTSGSDGPSASEVDSGALADGSAAPAAAVGAPFLPSRIWKLTTPQLTATLESIAPGSGALAAQFGTTSGSFGRFSNDATRLDFSPAVAASAATAALTVGGAAAQALIARHACAPSDTPSCREEILADLALRSFRRPLTPTERDGYLAFYEAQRSTLESTPSWAEVAAAFVLSPSTLFRSELGSPQPDGTVLLSAYEIASFLSYALTDGPPDGALLAAAAAGELATTEQRRAQAGRLLGTDAAADARVRFFRELYGYDQVLGAVKDATVFPTFSAAVGEDAVRATDAFVKDVFASSTPTLAQLLGSSRWFVDETLAAAYGIPGVAGSDLRPIDAPASERAGLLSQPSLLASFAKATETAPVQRGRLVRVQVLCEDLRPPPMGVPPLPSGTAASPRMRDRLAQHDSVPFCASCHQLMDPIGLAFETFDGIGRYRTTDHGLPIDPAGVLAGDGDLPFADAVSLLRALSTLPRAERCMVQQTLRWTAGSFTADANSPLVDDLTTRFHATGGNLRELLLDLVSHPYFVTRTRG